MLKSPIFHFFLVGIIAFAVLQFKPSDIQKPSSSTEDFRLISLTKSQLDAVRSRAALTKNETSKFLEASVSTFLDKELIYQEGIRLGLHKTDLIIVERLLKNMSFLAEDSEQEPDYRAMLDDAVALGMDERDPIIRRRVIQLVTLRAQEADIIPKPMDQQLLLFIHANPELFRQDARWDFEQIYFNPRHHKENIHSLLEETQQALQGSEAVAVKGDGSMLPGSMQLANLAQIKLHFGKQFADQFASLPVSQWSGPIQTKRGYHFVRVNKTIPERLPELKEVYNKAFIRWVNEQKQLSLARYIHKLRDSYHIKVNDEDPVSARQFPQYWAARWQ